MKKLVLFLSALVVLASCQKKQYATFQQSNTPTYATAKKQATIAQPTSEVVKEAEVMTVAPVEIAAPVAETLVADNSTTLESVILNSVANTKTTEKKVNTAKTASASILSKIENKVAFKSKLANKIIQKQLKKANAPVAGGGWSSLHKYIKLGIILLLASLLLGLVPVIGWRIASLASIAGVILIVLGLIQQYA